MGKISQTGINQGDLVKALQQTVTALRTGVIDLPPHTWLNEGGGTTAALAIFADGASAVPGFTNLSSEGLGVRWNNHATPTPIITSFVAPPDLDPTQDATLNVLAVRSTTDASDLVTFTVAAFKNDVGGVAGADADFGGATTALTDVETIEKVTLTLDDADLTATQGSVGLTLQPTDGLLATVDVTVLAIWIEYQRLMPTASATDITLTVT